MSCVPGNFGLGFLRASFLPEDRSGIYNRQDYISLILCVLFFAYAFPAPVYNNCSSYQVYDVQQ